MVDGFVRKQGLDLLRIKFDVTKKELVSKKTMSKLRLYGQEEKRKRWMPRQ